MTAVSKPNSRPPRAATIALRRTREFIGGLPHASRDRNVTRSGTAGPPPSSRRPVGGTVGTGPVPDKGGCPGPDRAPARRPRPAGPGWTSSLAGGAEGSATPGAGDERRPGDGLPDLHTNREWA